MTDLSQIDYSVLDRPEVTMFLFHPRAEGVFGESEPAPCRNVFIPVEENVSIGGCFHISSQVAPNILFFHGNGEIVADYHDMGAVYNRIGVNFLPVDYRGYGRSTGTPTVTTMMQDCHRIFDFVGKWLETEKLTGPLVVMGRSLGSASALELAAACPDAIDGLIIESGFAYAKPLLELLGIDVRSIGFEEKEGFRNVDKIRSFSKPTLIIHAEQDHIIPFSDGEALHDASAATEKTLLNVPGANHNDLLHVGFNEYMKAVHALIQNLQK